MHRAPARVAFSAIAVETKNLESFRVSMLTKPSGYVFLDSAKVFSLLHPVAVHMIERQKFNVRFIATWALASRITFAVMSHGFKATSSIPHFSSWTARTLALLASD
jgi:hypothetical protein